MMASLLLTGRVEGVGVRDIIEAASAAGVRERRPGGGGLAAATYPGLVLVAGRNDSGRFDHHDH